VRGCKRAARCGVHGACRTLCSCDNSNAPPRGTDARTEGPALGPTVYSYLLLLAVERMLEPPRLPLD
jgi:hypothetical protein